MIVPRPGARSSRRECRMNAHPSTPSPKPRVLVGGVWHETNSFSPVPTDLDAFRRFLIADGPGMAEALGGTNTEIGGMLEAGAEAGFDIIPAGWAGAVPSGMVTRAALDTIVAMLVAAATLRPDGVLIALHGAMVAEGIDEADAYVVQVLRDAVGPDIPIVCTIDYHANVSAALVAAADVLIGYDTLPHIDMAERGREAAAVMARLLAGAPRPAKAFRKLPLLTVPQMQGTAEAPMRDLMALTHRLEAGPDLLTASIIVGFPYCDVPQLGLSVLAYGTEAAASHAADTIADAIWRRRADFKPALLAPAAAVAAAVRANRGPIFLVEPADNVGGGAPGDGTDLLRALLAADAQDAACVIWDPAAAAEAARIGVGGRYRGPIGGHSMAGQGAVQIDGAITFAGEVRYRRDASWMTGQPANMGLVATIRAGGVAIIVSTERTMPFDTLHLRLPGINPISTKMITMKCGSAWSTAFGDIAVGHTYVDTPGICTSNLERLAFTRLPHPFYPLDPETAWP